MSYKPLSQTVTDGQKNPISSDAVHDHVASEISAIPASANPQLSNLSNTAVNANINMGTNQLQFNSGNRSSSISINALADVATGITTSVNNSTTINTSASITNVLQIGDVIYLNGLTPRAVVLTKPSATQITVSRALGDNTSREIYIEPQIFSILNSTTGVFSLTKQGYLSVNAPNTSLIIRPLPAFTVTGTNNIILGTTNTASALTTGSNNVFIGASNAASAAISGVVAIGQSASSSVNSGVSIGHNAAADVSGNTEPNIAIGYGTLWSNLVNASTKSIAIGYYAGGAIDTGSPRSKQTATICIGDNSFANGNEGVSSIAIGIDTQSLGVFNSGGYPGGGFSESRRNITNTIVIGREASSQELDNIFSTGSRRYQLYAAYFGLGARQAEGSVFRSFLISTGRGRGTDQSTFLGSLILSGAASTGNAIGGDVLIGSSNSSTSGTTVNNIKEHSRFTQDGKLGVGLFPKEVLHSNGAVKSHGDMILSLPGSGLKIAEGSDATMGVVTLTAGAATVNTSAVKSNSRIMLTNQNPGGTVGFLHVSTRTANTSFVITSSEAADTSDVAWMIVNPIVVDSDAQTFIDAIGSGNLTNLEQMAISELVKDLKDFSLWSKMKAIYPFVGGTSASCKWNLKNPVDTDAGFRLTYVGVNTFSSTGLTTTGTTGANTHMVPDNQFTSAQDLHIALYSRTAGSRLYDVGGGTNGISPALAIGYSTGSPALLELFGVYPTLAAGRGAGFYVGTSTATEHSIYGETSNSGVFSKLAIATRAARTLYTLGTRKLLLGGINNGSDAISSGSAREYSFLSIGDGLSNAECRNLFIAVDRFQATLNRRV